MPHSFQPWHPTFADDIEEELEPEEPDEEEQDVIAQESQRKRIGADPRGLKMRRHAGHR